MKSAFLVFVILISIGPLSAQILNNSFEDWVGGEPAYWFSSNDPFCSPGAVNIFQTSKSYSGNSAVYGKVISVNSIEVCGGGVLEFPPSIATYNGESDFIGFAVSGRPKQMRVHYIYKPVGDGGAFTASVYLTRWDIALGERVVVASGGFFIFNTIFLDSVYTEHVSAMSYYYDEDPDSVVFSFGLFSNGVGSEFYLDDISLSDMQLTSPSNDDVIIAGEKDTIKWDAGTGNIKIMYSLDDGNSYTTIENSYPADSNKYIWDVPDDLLSAKAKIRIEDTQDNTQYDEKSVYIKPWQLTRIDANGDFELFEPDEDGWQFQNDSSYMWPYDWWEQFGYSANDLDPITNKPFPQTMYFGVIPPSKFPNWDLFVDVFGTDQCYHSVETPSYKSNALLWWLRVESDYNGSCFGFSLSSLLGFYFKSTLRNIYPFEDFTNLYLVPLSLQNRIAINSLHLHQHSELIQNIRNNRKETVDALQTLKELKDMLSLKSSRTSAKPLAFYDSQISRGHSVVPYKLERDGNTSKFKLFVYDSEDPGSRNRVILIDSTANKWSDQTGLGFNGGTFGCFLDPGILNFLSTPLIASGGSNMVNSNYSEAKNNTINNSSELQNIIIYNSVSSEVVIGSPNGGQIGFQDSVAFNTMQNAFPMIPLTAKFHPPIGYLVPNNEYSIKLEKFLDTSTYVSIFDGSNVYNYSRNDASTNESDILSLKNEFGIFNPDASLKNINFQIIMEETDGSEKVFSTENIDISQNDSLHIKDNEHNELILKNYGIEKSYDLQIKSASDNGESIFSHNGISLADNSTHQIVPEWNDLQNAALKILIDLGNDGTIDDSIFIKNQATNIEDERLLLSPNNFDLAQNYPNPFNPTTTIQYSIPQRSNVAIKVYDILGNEVVNLVNEEKDRGVYDVTFDATELSSGIYFYTLRAGSFVQTKKMLLIK